MARDKIGLARPGEVVLLLRRPPAMTARTRSTLHIGGNSFDIILPLLRWFGHARRAAATLSDHPLSIAFVWHMHQPYYQVDEP